MAEKNPKSTRTFIAGALLLVMALLPNAVLQTTTLAQPTGSTQSPTYKFQIASYLPEGSAIVKAVEWWATEVERRSEGRVKFLRFYGGALLGATEIREALADGRIEFGHFAPAYYPGQFPLTDQILSIPFVTSNMPAGAQTFKELYETNPAAKKEWQDQGLHLIGVTAVAPTVLGVTSPVKHLDDLKGLRIRAVGGMIAPLKAVGANPVGIAAPEIYESLQHRTIDGFTAMPLDIAVAQGLHEVTSHWMNPRFGLYAQVNLATSLKVWNSLPPDIQKIMTGAADDMLPYLVRVYETLEIQACTKLKAARVTVSTLPDAEYQRWKQLVGDAPTQAWSKAVTAKGIDAQAYLNNYFAVLKKWEPKYSKYEPGIVRCAKGA